MVQLCRAVLLTSENVSLLMSFNITYIDPYTQHAEMQCEKCELKKCEIRVCVRGIFCALHLHCGFN